jgi:hypothetical protein
MLVGHRKFTDVTLKSVTVCTIDILCSGVEVENSMYTVNR